MKRRLPTTRKGEVVLAAISLPPLTDDANRHRPATRHEAAARTRADRGQRKAARLSGRADRFAAQIDGQRRKRDPEFPGACPEPAHPAPGRGMRHAGPRSRWPDPARAPGHLPDHRADSLGHVQPPGQHERRQQRMAHPAQAAPHPGHEDLRAAAARQASRPDMPPVTRPEHQRHAARRAGRAGDLHLPASRHIRIDRQRARPYDGHGRHRLRIPPRDRRQTRRGGIPHVQHRQQNPGPHSSSQEATSSKSTARHAAEMLRKSSRQHLARSVSTALLGRDGSPAGC